VGDVLAPHLTLAHIAREAGCSATQLSTAFRGLSRLSASTIEKVAAVMGVSVERLRDELAKVEVTTGEMVKLPVKNPMRHRRAPEVSDPQGRPVLTVAEAMRVLGVNRVRVHGLIRSGKLERYVCSGRTYVYADAVGKVKDVEGGAI
jgi:transcriptional regulator with XRE-family HTH domain